MQEAVCDLKVDPHNLDNNEAELNDSQAEFGAFNSAGIRRYMTNGMVAGSASS